MFNKRIYPLLVTLAAGASLYFFSESTDSQSRKGFYPPSKRFAIHAPHAKKAVTKTTEYASLLSPAEMNSSHVIDSFFRAMAYRQRFNGNALIAHDGKILFSGCFGYANYRKKILLTDSSQFQLGSVSKQFTAVAIMMLKQKGKLKYSDSIQMYFPDFPYHGITIQMLLDHRSGLPNYMYLCSSVCKNQQGYITNTDVVHYLTEYKPRRYFTPNKRFNYSNTNYCLLAAIVEKISGMSFSAFMSKNIFKPLHMNHTFVYDAHDTTIANKVQGYNANYLRSGVDFLDGVTGDKGVYSTIGDLFKWDQALYGNSLLKQSTLAAAFKPHGRWVRHHNYGYGWWLVPFGNDTITYHDGWWHGFNCAFIRDIKYRNTIIVLSNHVNWCINRSRNLLTILRNVLKEDTNKRNMDAVAESGKAAGETHS